MGDYRNLRVWQLSQKLACDIASATQGLPRGHSDTADQVRRASLSIPTNLAEGSGRGKDGDFGRYINIAIGSAAETESLLLHLRDTTALRPSVMQALLGDIKSVRRMLFKPRTAVRGKNEAAPVRAPRTDSGPKSRDQSPSTSAEDVSPETGT